MCVWGTCEKSVRRSLWPGISRCFEKNWCSPATSASIICLFSLSISSVSAYGQSFSALASVIYCCWGVEGFQPVHRSSYSRDCISPMSSSFSETHLSFCIFCGKRAPWTNAPRRERRCNQSWSGVSRWPSWWGSAPLGGWCPMGTISLQIRSWPSTPACAWPSLLSGHKHMDNKSVCSFYPRFYQLQIQLNFTSYLAFHIAVEGFPALATSRQAFFSVYHKSVFQCVELVLTGILYCLLSLRSG